MSPYRILFLSPPLTGHTSQLITLAGEMIGRGHDAAYANTPLMETSIRKQGIPFLHWDFESAVSDPDLVQRRATLWARASKESRVLRGEKWMFEVTVDTYLPMRNTLAPLIESYRPDLIVVDSALYVAMDLARHYRIPYVVVAQFVGSHIPLDSSVPRYGTSFCEPMSGLQRILNRIHPLVSNLHYLPGFLTVNRIRKSCGSTVSIHDLYYKSRMIFVTAFGFERPRPVPPLMELVGPIQSCQPETLESGALKQWLDSGKPIVFVAFGTLVQLTPNFLQALVEGMKSEHFDVLWSLKPDRRPKDIGIPENFRMESYVPQRAVLVHPSVKLFVLHCGMNSISESMIAGKPMLGIPIFGDQHYNSARIHDLKIGLRLDKAKLSSNQVKACVDRLLNEPQFLEAARQASKVIRCTGGRKRAADILEETLELGIRHLVP